MRAVVFPGGAMTRAFGMMAWIGLVTSTALAGLSWEQTMIEHETAGDEARFDTAFHFKNTGRKTITIESIETSCSCTTATVERNVFAPNESGEIKVRFDVGGQTGAQEKTITVKTDDFSEAPSALVLRVKIPQPFRASSQHLLWSIGEDPAEKSVTIVLNPSAHAELSLPVLLPKSLSVRVAEGTAAGTYLLWIKPQSTATPFESVVNLRVERSRFVPLLVAIEAQVR